MGITNRGNQLISINYKEQLRSQVANQRLESIFKVGTYTGFELTKVSDVLIEISAGALFITDSSVEIGVRVKNQDDIVDQVISNTTPYVVARYIWINSENNYVDYFSVAIGDILSDDVIIGKANYTGVTLVDFDYTERTVGNAVGAIVDTHANLTANNPLIHNGQALWTTDTDFFTIGDGATLYNDLIGFTFHHATNSIAFNGFFETKIGVGRIPTAEGDFYNASGNAFVKAESGVAANAGVILKNTSNEWLAAVENTTGDFLIVDQVTTNKVFSISKGLSNNALNLNSNGLGIGRVATGNGDFYDSASSCILKCESGVDADAAFMLKNSIQEWRFINSSSGDFRIYDVTNNKTPLVIKPNAPNYSIYMNASGYTAFGSSTVSDRVHIYGALRIEDSIAQINAVTTNGSSGFYIDVLGNTSGNVLRIAQDGTVKISMGYNAPANSLVIAAFTGNVQFAGGIDPGANGTYLKKKVIEIGDWNMDTTASIIIAHGLTFANIRTCEVMIRNDDNSVFYPIHYTLSGASVSGRTAVNTINVVISRAEAGFFDNTNFNSTSYNRGWITIWYKA